MTDVRAAAREATVPMYLGPRVWARFGWEDATSDFPPPPPTRNAELIEYQRGWTLRRMLAAVLS